MGLVNLWAISHLSLRSPLLCSFFSWLLFITSGVALGATSKEVVRIPPLLLLPEKGLPEQKGLDLLYVSHGAEARAVDSRA